MGATPTAAPVVGVDALLDEGDRLLDEGQRDHADVPAAGTPADYADSSH